MGYEIINFDNSTDDVNSIKMFFGKSDFIQRYDRYKYEIFKKLYEAQEAARWKPKEINFSKDKANMSNISQGHQAIYRDNLLFQTLADSMANRFLEDILCRCITSPELEAVIKTQGNFELLHSFSYSYNIRQVYTNPEDFFNEGFRNPEIQNRLNLEKDVYMVLDRILSDPNELYGSDKQKYALVEALIHQYVLENIRFFVSFLYNFMLNELNDQCLQGSVNNNTLILNDEVIHTVIFKNILNIAFKNEDEGLKHIVDSQWFINKVNEVFESVKQSEMQWFKHLQSLDNIDGITDTTINGFLDFYIYKAKKAINIEAEVITENDLVSFFETKKNINNQKAAAQETNLLSYNVGVLVDSGYQDKDYTKILIGGVHG